MGDSGRRPGEGSSSAAERAAPSSVAPSNLAQLRPSRSGRSPGTILPLPIPHLATLSAFGFSFPSRGFHPPASVSNFPLLRRLLSYPLCSPPPTLLQLIAERSPNNPHKANKLKNVSTAHIHVSFLSLPEGQMTPGGFGSASSERPESFQNILSHETAGCFLSSSPLLRTFFILNPPQPRDVSPLHRWRTWSREVTPTIIDLILLM